MYGKTVCGYVNAKNAYGSYVGWVGFTASIDGSEGKIYSDEGWLFESLCHGEPVPT